MDGSKEVRKVGRKPRKEGRKEGRTGIARGGHRYKITKSKR